MKPGWTRVALGDVVDVVTDYWDRQSTERFVAGEHIDEGSLRVTRWGMTSDDLVPPTFNRRFRAGDVLFHSRNLAKLACPDFDGITGEKLFVLRSKDARRLLPELLPYLLQSDAFDEYVNRMWAGSTNKFLNKAPLVAYEFALPPLEEQRRAVGVLVAAERLHQEVSTSARLAARLPDAFLSAHLRHLFGTDEPLKFRSTTGSGGLCLRRAGDVLTARQGLQITQTQRRKEPGPGLHPYLTAQYMLHGGELEYVQATSMRVICSPQDVLVLRTGMTNGEVFTGRAGAFHNNFFAVDYDAEELNRDYLIAYLSHPNVRHIMRTWSGATNIPDLNHGDFYAIPFPVPALSQQREVATKYAELKASAVAARQRVVRAQDLRARVSRSVTECA